MGRETEGRQGIDGEAESEKYVLEEREIDGEGTRNRRETQRERETTLLICLLDQVRSRRGHLTA